MFKEQLAKLIDSRPKAVSQLFSRYGYNVKRPTVQLVIDACIVKKEPFINDLSEILSGNDSYNGSKLQEFITKGIAALTGVNAIGVGLDNKKSEAEKQLQLEAEAEKSRIFGFDPKLLYALIAVVIIMLLLFIFKNK